jgi:thiamine-monophosphate kinase
MINNIAIFTLYDQGFPRIAATFLVVAGDLRLLLVQGQHAIIVAMKVSELGEFGLIELLRQQVDQYRDKLSSTWNKLVIGIGDDAAAWHSERGVEMITTDSFIEDVHFATSFFPWQDIGWKAIAINLSDIAAMGAVPRYAVVSMAIPETTEVADIILLYQGMAELAGQAGVAIVGGNISSASRLMINITVTAMAPGENAILTRYGARAGDKIAVTGYLGAASVGLEILRGNIDTHTEDSALLKEAFLHPIPRIAEGQILVKQGIRAAIDISDGFCSDLRHICKNSRLGARIEVDRIPVQPGLAAVVGDRTLEVALSGGEDYELIFTGTSGNISRVTEQAECPITVVGEMTAEDKGEVILVDSQGDYFKAGKYGWEHFKENL